uniref:Uncharacterized protein n=1 Tax=Salmonella sp. TaxID=599 RepID=A0A482EV94_SALSP|nr:hypothetical protein NNIBIDOC_00019 [Salmonella sp.]
MAPFYNWLTVNGEPERFQLLPVAAETSVTRTKVSLVAIAPILHLLVILHCHHFVISSFKRRVKFRNFFCVLNSFSNKSHYQTIIQWVIKMPQNKPPALFYPQFGGF